MRSTRYTKVVGFLFLSLAALLLTAPLAATAQTGLHVQPANPRHPAEKSSPRGVFPAGKSRPVEAHPDAVTYTESVVYSFPNGAGQDNDGPAGNLIQAPDGNLWGTTQLTGANDLGEVFRITPAGVFTDVHDFSGPDGAYPFGNLVIGHDGALYGVTSAIGSDYSGTIYKVTTAGVFTVLATFNNGEGPAGLVQDPSGNFYGVTYAGGANGDGEIFRYAPGSGITDLHDCTATDCSGALSTLVQGSDGNFYGTSRAGGADGLGNIFSVTPGGVFTTVYSCTGSNSDCYYPAGGLVEIANGQLWGHSEYGGPYQGDFYYLTPNGSGGFTYQEYAYCECIPFAGTMTLGGDAELYAAPAFGGNDGDGVVYNFVTAAFGYDDLHDFTGDPDGQNPYADPIETADGNLWGTTAIGGSANEGTIYEIVPSTPLPPTISLSLNPATIVAGQNVTATYSVTNAYSTTAQQCYLYLDSVPVSSSPVGTSGSSTYSTAFMSAGTYTAAYSCGGVQSATATLTLTPPSLTFSSVTHNFGTFVVGQAATTYGVSVKNTGSAAVSSSGITLSGPSEFTEQTNCPASLAAGASCEIVFTFTPTTPGSATAKWSIAGTGQATTFNPSNGGTLTASATAAPGSLTLTTNGHNFGTVSVGTTTAAYGTVLKNTYSSAVSLTYGSVSAPFLVSGDNCGATLGAGQSCNLQFEFSPTAAGTFQQNYTISATMGGSPVAITAGGVTSTGIKLTGTGH